MKNLMSKREKSMERVYYVQRLSTLLALFFVFFPAMNPAKISGLIGRTLSLFTSGISYSSLTSEMGRAFNRGWLEESSIVILYVASLLLLVGIALCCAATCMSLGNLKLKNLGKYFSLGGSVLMAGGMALILVSYNQIIQTTKPEKVEPGFPAAYYLYLVLTVLLLLSSVIVFCMMPKPEKDSKFEIESKYKLFLMFLPFAMLCFVFSYLPLYGWRYAFFEYSAGGTLSMDNFVGFHWFTMLFSNAATRADILRVLRNTLAMSGLGILTSWLPIAFAIFLNEIRNTHFRRVIQTVTTIPNFISWVLVYAIALAIFSTDGFINTMFGGDTNYLMSTTNIWLKMLLWGTWKGIGWSAIIYIAGISGIDQQLYEAATVDGAGRFQKMWHITVPGLLPTYFVMLLMAIANILSNGMDQYLVFSNARNKDLIEVLDLYVYNLGILNGIIPLSTVVGMVTSRVSVILLFSANRFSKAVRGESIV